MPPFVHRTRLLFMVPALRGRRDSPSFLSGWMKPPHARLLGIMSTRPSWSDEESHRSGGECSAGGVGPWAMGCCVGSGACFGKKSKWACDARCSSCGCGRIIGGATLSEGAGTRIRTLLDQRQREYLRLGVMVRSCDGLTYTLMIGASSMR